jgi:hypothetical protein
MKIEYLNPYSKNVVADCKYSTANFIPKILIE